MAVPTTGSLFSQESGRIQEVLSKSIETFLPAIDPAWRNTGLTSMGVIPPSELGRDYKYIKIYNTGVSGVVEMADGRSNFNLFGDPLAANVGDMLQTQSIGQTWPDPTTGATVRSFKFGVTIQSMLTTLLLTMAENRAEATQAFIGQVIEPKLTGHARMIAHQFATYFYLSGNTNYALGTISSSGYAEAYSTNTTITFTTTEDVNDRFLVGMRVDVWNSGGTVRRNESGGVRVPCFVTKVDEVDNTVTITMVGFDGTGAGPDDIVTLANSKGYGFPGVNTYLKNTGTISGGDSSNTIGVDTYPMFKSWIKTSFGSVTEHQLRRVLASWNRAKSKYGQTIDTFIASDGVWLHYESQRIAREIFDRTGRLPGFKNEGSENGEPVFHFGGRTFKCATSTYVDTGTVYGLKLEGKNWKRIVPPSPKGTTKDSRQESFVPFEFVGKALGHADNKIPITRNNGVNGISLPTEGMQLPGMVTMGMVPDQMTGIKLTGCTEDRLASTNS